MEGPARRRTVATPAVTHLTAGAGTLIQIESEQSTIGAVKELIAQGLSLSKLSDELAKGDLFNRLGNPFTAVQLERILKHDAKRNAEAPAAAAAIGGSKLNYYDGYKFRLHQQRLLK